MLALNNRIIDFLAIEAPTKLGLTNFHNPKLDLGSKDYCGKQNEMLNQV